MATSDQQEKRKLSREELTVIDAAVDAALLEEDQSKTTDAPAQEKGALGLKIDEIRAKQPWFDHVVRAGSRYSERNGDYYAAAITYFSFLAIFPLLLVAVSVFGFFLRLDPNLLTEVSKAITNNVPGAVGDLLIETIDGARKSATGIGILGLLIFLYSGLGWIGNLREAVQTMWGKPRAEPSFVKDKAFDLLSLGGLGLALVVSIAVSALATGLTGFVLDLLGLNEIPGAKILAAVIGILIALLTNVLLFIYILVALPRQKTPVKSVLRGAIFGAIAFEILKQVGTYYIGRVTQSPAAGIFGSILGLLVWINLVCRLLLFVVTWTATSRPVLRLRAQEAAAATPISEALTPIAQTAGLRGIPRKPTDRPLSGSAVLGILLTIGAALGALLPRTLRRWWTKNHPT